MEKNEGLIRARKSMGYTQAKFAELCGVHLRTIQNWEAGAPIPISKYALLHKVLGEKMANESDVSPIVEQDVRPYTTNSQGVKFYEQQDGQLLMEVPIVPFDALGSMADDYTELVASRGDDEKMSFTVDSVHHGRYFAFVVDNDSMDDGTRGSFQKGDTVLVRELDKQDWRPHLYINKWRFWVVCFGNCIRIKEIVAQDEKVGTITLHSLNPSPEYTDFTLKLDEVSRLFNVVKRQPKEWNYE